MKALVLRRPGDLVVAEVDTPQPHGDEVLVRVTNSGICGTDLKIYTGGMPASYPIIMGHEISGDVVDTNGGGHVLAGQRVLVDPVLYCGTCADCRAGRTNLCATGGIIGREVNGGFADYVVAPRSHVYALPPSIDSQTAPLIQVLTTCLHAQRRADLSAGQSVAVIGLGVSGQLHVQLAKARGAGVAIGITRSAWKRSLAGQLGADLTAGSGEEGVRAVQGATDGHGADIVIESTGHVQSLADAIAMVRPGGTIVLFGIYTASEGALPFYQLYYKEPTIVSARAATSEDFPESIDLIARGAVKLAPLVTQVLPLSRLREALGMLQSDADGRMKIILAHRDQ
ncbi:MAG TPA: alcohol dehydrogenase catalytic domain-containing protein [Vicinamibacterales bacterium]